MLQDAFIFSLLLHRAALFYFGAHIMCPSSDLQYSVMAPLRSRHMATRWGIDATIFPKARERFTFSQHTAFRTKVARRANSRGERHGKAQSKGYGTTDFFVGHPSPKYFLTAMEVRRVLGLSP